EAARRMGYRPNRAAQIMKFGKSQTIALIEFGIQSEVSHAIHYHVAKAVSRAGYDYLPVFGFLKEDVDSLVARIVDARVDGAIISKMAAHFGIEQVRILQRAGIPVVGLLSREFPDVPLVLHDAEGGFATLTRHLLALGRRRLLLMIPDYPMKVWTTEGRMRGFRKAIQGAGGSVRLNASAEHVLPDRTTTGVTGEILKVPVGLPPYSSSDLSPAYWAARAILKRPRLPDAILGSNDQWARSAISALMESGLRVPEDLVVTGYDNDSWSAYYPFRLTTVQPDTERECGMAVELLFKKIAGEKRLPRRVVMPCTLVVRTSCGSVPTSHAQKNFIYRVDKIGAV
ncbi:MAG: LacI family DNA-binding transcriptional regulator, partial [Kiritimatiellia bacterium]|nr:LacI family DNA-binding transcriptional regulator [Kiritimatiellia bacterium]